MNSCTLLILRINNSKILKKLKKNFKKVIKIYIVNYINR